MKEDKHSGYYEAILQLREVNQEVIEFTLHEIEKRKVGIAKVVKLKTGIDYYLTDQQFTRALGKTLQKTFGGELLVTAKLFGMKKGKRLYRVTVLFRAIHVKKSDIIEYGGETYQVKGINKSILAIHVKTKEKIRIPFKDRKKVKIL